VNTSADKRVYQTVFGVCRCAALIAASWLLCSPVQAQGETFQVLTVNTTGCNSGGFSMTVERANLDGGSYIVRTLVTVGALVYMNEQASISFNGTSGWNVFDNFTYGPVPNQGTYPIPVDEQMRLDFTLERPKGSVLYRWTLVVDGCNTGNILFNGVPFVSDIPTLSGWGILAFAAILVSAFIWLERRR
jgi:hypothetical protein